MPWWNILLWILGGILAFDCLFLGLLYVFNRSTRGAPQIVQPNAKGTAQAAKPSLWTIEGGGS